MAKAESERIITINSWNEWGEGSFWSQTQTVVRLIWKLLKQSSEQINSNSMGLNENQKLS